jgi:hypothetical protein
MALTLTVSSPARAWDPDLEDPAAPAEAAAWTPEPAPVAPPEGIYLVTEAYVDDVVTRSGPVTTYATETVHEITGSYARVLETVPTGGSSGYDGAAFNGRAALTDGRSVAGTYYENFVRTDSGYIPVSIVFFQDDQEIARAGRTDVPASGSTPLTSAPAPAVSAPAGAVAPIVDPAGGRAPIDEREDRVPPVAPGRPTFAPAPDRSFEVLRARRIALSLDGPGVVRWRFVSGDAVALGPLGGGAAERFFARWDRLAPSGESWVTRFLVDLADGTTREIAIRVTVRAPGLIG